MKTNSLRAGIALRAVKLPEIILLLLMSLNITSVQAACQKEIHYRLLQERYHALETGVDITTVSEVELLLGKPTVQYADVVICIDELGFFTKTSTYTYGVPVYYPNRIHQTIETATEISSYDDQGVLLFSLPNDPQEIVGIPGIGRAMTATEISGFGVDLNFSKLIPSSQSQFAALGGTYWNVGNKNFFSTTDLEMIIAVDDQYLMTRHYDHNGVLTTMKVKTALVRNGLHLPQLDLRMEYKLLGNGSMMQTTFKDSYVEYAVYEQGVPIVQLVQADNPYAVAQNKDHAPAVDQTQFSSYDRPQRLQRPDLSIFPNPASELLNVELGALWSGKPVSWQIQSATGQTMRSGLKPASEEQLSIALADWPPGIYVLHLDQAGTTIAKKFILAK